MKGHNNAFMIWGVVAAVLVVGGAAAVYLGGRSDSSLAEEANVAASSPGSVDRGMPAARPAGANDIAGGAADVGRASSAAAEAAAAAGAAETAEVAAGAIAGSVAAADAGGIDAATAAAPAMPAPSLDDSDDDVRGELNELVGERVAAQYVVPERIIRNVVVTLDNLTLQKASLEQRPVKPTPGKFVTAGTENAPVLSPQNYARYEPFVNVVQRVDARRFVALYRDLQPLFQAAYEELGHPDESFTERLLEIIEHLLETPEVEGTIRLKQPGLLYEYADEELQSLSVGKKLLIRVGPKNRAAIKQKLREIRAELV